MGVGLISALAVEPPSPTKSTYVTEFFSSTSHQKELTNILQPNPRFCGIKKEPSNDTYSTVIKIMFIDNMSQWRT